MQRVRIKICGITTLADAQLATQLGADAIGLNLFSGSKRYVDPDLARQIAQALPASVEAMVLFVNERLPQAQALAEPISRTIQWHGAEPPLPPPLPWRFIPAFNVADTASLAVVKAYVARCRAADRLPAAVLLDSHVTGQYGGTGQTAPWHLLAGFDAGVPIMLAGGLTPENVADAIRLVRPYAVDVASGVEGAPGRKDPKKLRRFMEAVHKADLES
jgi:phosphoribosylanthranilate isomerase